MDDFDAKVEVERMREGEGEKEQTPRVCAYDTVVLYVCMCSSSGGDGWTVRVRVEYTSAARWDVARGKEDHRIKG